MKIQSINQQTNYNNPVCFTSKDQIIRAVNAPLTELRVKRPNILERLRGHKYVKSPDVFYIDGLRKGKKLTATGEIKVLASKPMDGEINAPKIYVYLGAKMNGKGTATENARLRGIISEVGELHSEGDFRIDPVAVVEGEASSVGKMTISGKVTKTGIISAKKIEADGATIDGISNSKTFHLSGPSTGKGVINTKNFNSYALSHIEKEMVINCKRIEYFGTSRESFEGIINTERCPKELLKKYPNNIKIQEPGWYKKHYEFVNYVFN